MFRGREEPGPRNLSAALVSRWEARLCQVRTHPPPRPRPVLLPRFSSLRLHPLRPVSPANTLEVLQGLTVASGSAPASPPRLIFKPGAELFPED